MQALKQLRICMVAPCANDVSGASNRDESKQSPVLHIAMHNLLEGFRERNDIELDVVYGRTDPQPGEDRHDGSIHYVPVVYKPLPVPGMGGPYLARSIALLKHIRKIKPDIVHGQGTERESGLVAALNRHPSILTLHGNFRELAKSIKAKRFSYFGFASMIERFCLPRVTAVHCLSSHTRASVGTLAKQTYIIPNAVNPRFFEINRNPAPHPYVICVAGIAEWKNPMLLVEAGDRLRQIFLETQIHFVGSCNPEHPYGRSFMDAVSERSWCHYHSQCPPEGLIPHMSRATCAVLPSRQENFGLALAESLAAGIPVIGSKVGGIPDIVQDGETGYLFDSDSSIDLAGKLIALHSDKSMANRFALAAKADALARFSIKSVADAHIGMYREVFSKSYH